MNRRMLGNDALTLVFRPRPAWMADAACAGATEVMYPAVRESDRRRAPYQAALDVCAACPVRAECLAEVLSYDDIGGGTIRHGVWGGTTPWQRSVWRRTGQLPELEC